MKTVVKNTGRKSLVSREAKSAKSKTGGRQPGSGRPRLKITPQLQKMIAAHLACGRSLRQITAYTGISYPALVNYLGTENYQEAKEQVDAMYAGRLHAIAMNPKHGQSFSAVTFYLSRRAGWTEKSALELSGPNGGAVNIKHDLSKLSEDELITLDVTLQKALVSPADAK